MQYNWRDTVVTGSVVVADGLVLVICNYHDITLAGRGGSTNAQYNRTDSRFAPSQ